MSINKSCELVGPLIKPLIGVYVILILLQSTNNSRSNPFFRCSATYGPRHSSESDYCGPLHYRIITEKSQKLTRKHSMAQIDNQSPVFLRIYEKNEEEMRVLPCGSNIAGVAAVPTNSKLGKAMDRKKGDIRSLLHPSVHLWVNFHKKGTTYVWLVIGCNCENSVSEDI